MKTKKSTLIYWIFLIIMIAVTYLPLAILTVYSFTNSKTIGVWNGFSFDLYRQLFNDPAIMGALRNTFFIGFASSLLAVILGTMASIGIHNMKKVPKTIMEGVNQITMVNADIVTAVGFMLLFMFVIVIPNEYVLLIIAHTTICTPYVIMSVLPRLGQLNPNVYEAGLDLGASPMKAVLKVILPQLLPGIFAGFVLAFTISLDDFTISTLVSSSVNTIPRYLYNKLKVKGVMPVLRSLSVIIMIAVMIVLVLVNIASSKAEKKKKQMEKLIGR